MYMYDEECIGFLSLICVQLQSYVQRLKFEKEQLEQQLRHLRVERSDKTEIDTKYKHLVEDSKRLRK